MNERVTVWAEARLPGFHHWPDAPLHRSYLAQRHRHLFHIRATVRVTHDDRDVEFHDLADAIRAWWGPEDRECVSRSCEALARELAGHLLERGMTVTQVDVSEDGETGATYRPGKTP